MKQCPPLSDNLQPATCNPQPATSNPQPTTAFHYWKTYPEYYIFVTRIFNIMATVIIDTRSKEAKKILEFLKTTRYSKVFEEDVPNAETRRAINEVEAGNVKSYSSVNELMETLNKAAGV
jgi:hypothetical protein